MNAFDARTSLERTKLKGVYRQRLAKARAVLTAWAAMRGVSVEALVRSPQILDAHLAHFVQYCRDSSKPLYIAKHAVLAIMLRHRHLRGSLNRTWDGLKSWEDKTFWSPRKPFTKLLIDFVFITALEIGLGSLGDARYLFPLAGALLRMAFYGLLRPGELTGAFVGDLMFCEEPGEQLRVILAIRDPKTRTWMGRAQFSTIRDAPTARWLQWLVQGRSPSEKLWPASPGLLRRFLTAILGRGGLGDLKFTLGSCRPGGATFYFLQNTPVEQLQFMGRWRAVTSLKAYIQEAMAILVWHRIPADQLASIRSRLLSAQVFLDGPPLLSWQAILTRHGESFRDRRREAYRAGGVYARLGGNRQPLKVAPLCNRPSVSRGRLRSSSSIARGGTRLR